MLYDKDMREPLCNYLEDRFGKIRIFEEKVMKKVRADLIMVLPDKIIGIEIKSRAFIVQKLLDKIEWPALKVQVCEELFQRDYTLQNSDDIL